MRSSTSVSQAKGSTPLSLAVATKLATTAANADMRPVHDRMPLILDDEQIEQWLDPDYPDPAAVLTSVPDDELVLVPVSDWVNNARHEGPQCLEEV
jgi:putative SOS response-associated peptidase YedK